MAVNSHLLINPTEAFKDVHYRIEFNAWLINSKNEALVQLYSANEPYQWHGILCVKCSKGIRTKPFISEKIVEAIKTTLYNFSAGHQCGYGERMKVEYPCFRCQKRKPISNHLLCPKCYEEMHL